MPAAMEMIRAMRWRYESSGKASTQEAIDTRANVASFKFGGKLCEGKKEFNFIPEH